jgi:hypothetical protein
MCPDYTPVMVALAREGIFRAFESAPEGVDLSSLPGNPRSPACVFELLALQR